MADGERSPCRWLNVGPAARAFNNVKLIARRDREANQANPFLDATA
jgi:hypothetical protein